MLLGKSLSKWKKKKRGVPISSDSEMTQSGGLSLKVFL